jgi:hypothetical protein
MPRHRPRGPARDGARVPKLTFPTQDYYSRKTVLVPWPLQEQILRAQLKICTEADYLQAHLTVIEGESRDKNLSLHNVKQRVKSVLKKWILGANANLKPNGKI